MSSKTCLNETWRENVLPGYDVSSAGRVYSHRSNNFLNPYKSRGGYLQVNIVGKPWFLSHLVWLAFKGEKPRRLSYENGDITDCSLDNLRRTDEALGEFE